MKPILPRTPSTLGIHSVALYGEDLDVIVRFFQDAGNPDAEKREYGLIYKSDPIVISTPEYEWESLDELKREKVAIRELKIVKGERLRFSYDAGILTLSTFSEDLDPITFASFERMGRYLESKRVSAWNFRSFFSLVSIIGISFGVQSLLKKYFGGSGFLASLILSFALGSFLAPIFIRFEMRRVIYTGPRESLLIWNRIVKSDAISGIPALVVSNIVTAIVVFLIGKGCGPSTP